MPSSGAVALGAAYSATATGIADAREAAFDSFNRVNAAEEHTLPVETRVVRPFRFKGAYRVRRDLRRFEPQVLAFNVQAVVAHGVGDRPTKAEVVDEALNKG